MTFAAIDLVGYLAAAFTLAAYSMRTMLPLRVVAIAANMSFITWSFAAGITPTLLLHGILLPFNSYRLWEIVNQTRQARAARQSAVDLAGFLAPFLTARRLPRGAPVFAKGDAADRLYLVKSGTVRLDEIDTDLSEGELFGEIAFFTDAKERTLSATCLTDCEILEVDEAAFMRVYYQNPAFGLAITRLVVQRLIEGAARRPGVYAPAGSAVAQGPA